MQIHVDMEALDKARKYLGKSSSKYEKAIQFASNRALDAAKTQAVRSAREVYNTTANTIREGIYVRKDVKLLIARGSPIALMQFKVHPSKPKKAVVKAAVKGVGGTINYAFIAQMPNGHIGVYRRTGVHRFPIQELYTVSNPQMVGEPNVLADVEARTVHVFTDRINHHIERILEE